MTLPDTAALDEPAALNLPELFLQHQFVPLLDAQGVMTFITSRNIHRYAKCVCVEREREGWGGGGGWGAGGVEGGRKTKRERERKREIATLATCMLDLPSPKMMLNNK